MLTRGKFVAMILSASEVNNFEHILSTYVFQWSMSIILGFKGSSKGTHEIELKECK